VSPAVPAAVSGDLRRSLDDPAEFLRLLTGRPAWAHQAEVLRSGARFRVICSGRQSGKSVTVGGAALHQAFTKAGSTVLLVSAGEASSRRLLAEVASMASGPLLSGSVVDEGKSQVTLSNGSVIMSVPASQRQIRGWAIDLLVLDEAGFIDPDLWRAAEPTIIARPGSRVILCSSPWGGADHFFRALWQRGTDADCKLLTAGEIHSLINVGRIAGIGADKRLQRRLGILCKVRQSLPYRL
jgi:hypothetical protein